MSTMGRRSQLNTRWMGGEKRDDSVGNCHSGLRPEMAGLLCPGPFAGVHPVKKRTDSI